MRFFLVVLLALPATGLGAESVLYSRLGTSSALFLNSKPLIVELREEKDRLGTSLYVGTVTAPTNNLSISIGASSRVTLDAPAKDGVSFADSDAVRAFYRTQMEKLTELGSSRWSLRGKLGVNPKASVTYYTDHKRDESHRAEIKYDPLGRPQLWYFYEYKGFWQ